MATPPIPGRSTRPHHKRRARDAQHVGPSRRPRLPAPNPSPSATPAPDAQPRGWKDSLRDAVNAVTATTSARGEGRGQPATKQPPPSRRHVRPAVAELTPSSTEAARTAVARYQYLLQTAPPGQLERVHTDAFNRLTPVERAHLHHSSAPACPCEQPGTTDAAELARTAPTCRGIPPRRARPNLGRGC